MTEKYELFKVANELVFSDSREKVKEYARSKDIDSISYRYSSNDKDSLKEIAKEI
ncbi:hypothetical protein Halha_2151 [Halobacteroides halobius DSM 5150]|uniref:Uncharacterized protein n=1 Tax=Halobacteroides halobius (strain ATCC 35273 / DSM 5150 / MD-1) TaxID=748449 RepID=L0KCD0_HALHC|nr:hypothetical protein [Halobacteroides halobius]AGB42034.1 hypothetical protein Halha_2151 [Halobacteroides halobius DSM 5150]